MTGLCLAGGGIKAAAHIGALKAFEEENIKFDCVSGASSGSIVATMCALGYNSNQMWKMFRKYFKKIKYAEWKQIIKMIVGLIFSNGIVIDGLNTGKILEKIINEICLKSGIYNINQIKMPLLISMVDLQRGTVYIASSKEVRASLLDDVKYMNNIPIGTAVRASCSFPVVFSPCTYKGIQLIDGGTRENLPWKELKNIGADKIYGVVFDTIIKENDCCQNIIDVASRAMDLQGRELALYEKTGIENLITIKTEKVPLLNTSKIETLYRKGYEETRKQLKLITREK